MKHLKLYEDLHRRDYSDSQIIKAVKIIKDHAESIGNDPEGKAAYIFRVDDNMVFFKSLVKGISIETLEAELPEMEKWGKEIVDQIESETSILDIEYMAFIDRREDFLGIGIRFFFPFDIEDNIAVAVEESQLAPLQYSGGDVTSMPLIGKVITKPIGPFEAGEYDIVEIIDTPGGPIYVTNRWYKERKRIPQLIHSELVGEWVPKEA